MPFRPTFLPPLSPPREEETTINDAFVCRVVALDHERFFLLWINFLFFGSFISEGFERLRCRQSRVHINPRTRGQINGMKEATCDKSVMNLLPRTSVILRLSRSRRVGLGRIWKLDAINVAGGKGGNSKQSCRLPVKTRALRGSFADNPAISEI